MISKLNFKGNMLVIVLYLKICLNLFAYIYNARTNLKEFFFIAAVIVLY